MIGNKAYQGGGKEWGLNSEGRLSRSCYVKVLFRNEDSDQLQGRGRRCIHGDEKFRCHDIRTQRSTNAIRRLERETTVWTFFCEREK